MKKKLYKALTRELDALGMKTSELNEFVFYSEEYTHLRRIDKSLLMVQLEAMQTYYSVLEARLDNG